VSLDRRAAERFDAMDRGGSTASRLLVRGVMLAVLGIGAWAAYQSLIAGRDDDRMIQSIELLGPVLPPKPEPEPEPLPEEMEVEDTEVELEAPVDQSEPAGATDDRLGVDGDATGTGDGFGLVAKRGGREIIGLEGQGTGDGAMMAMLVGQFARSVREDIERQLAGRIDLRKQNYVAIVKLWVEPDGRLLRFELPQPPADQELRAALELALGSLQQVTPPPAGMPQPIWLRITSRING